MLVDFSCVDCFGVIVKAPTGVRYTSQTGGMGCHHPEIEGFFVPLNAGNQNSIEDELHKHLCGDLADYENPPDLKEMNTLLSFPWVTLEVDLSEKGTEEAWIHIIITDGRGGFSPFEKLVGMKGVFVYGNCD